MPRSSSSAGASRAKADAVVAIEDNEYTRDHIVYAARALQLYARVGDLKPHVDREQNAVSLSLNLGQAPADAPPWPLWVAPRGAGEAAGVPLRLAPGDALLYGGVHHTHFRRPLEGAEGSMQVIFGFRDMNEAHCNSQ